MKRGKWALFVLVTSMLCGCEKEEVTTITLSEELHSIEMEEIENIEEEKQTKIVVYIHGAVKMEGVYELPSASRVIDAIVAAGGFSENAKESWVNQARILQDGEQIFIPTIDEASALEEKGIGSKAPETSQEDGRINLNQATLQQLMTLPGIGEAKAKRIIEYRQISGNFLQIEDLKKVPGIKDGVYNQIKDLIKIE